MPFIPHTEQDIQEMLSAIGVEKLDTLFDEIPATLRHAPLESLPPGMSEMTLSKLAHERAKQDAELTCYIGAGAYEHHIPAVVWEIATRGEFYTAYTPYQAEASQGSLQLIYEYQTMMASLMAMEVSNASLYDGASALAEAVLMAVRLSAKKGRTSVLIPRNLHPYYRATVHAIVYQQDIQLVEVPYQQETGQVDQQALSQLLTEEVVALIIAQPNFFGVLEEVDKLSDWAREHHLLSIAVVNPMAMALLKPPGEWGEAGVDIACGEGQPLGIPLASGGPYFGFLCTRKTHVRQMPGRIVGKTIDLEGKPGYVLTLQAREQHIRRAKATSNICTNQGLMVTAATVYMSLLGPAGLRQVALACHQRTQELLAALKKISGMTQVFNAPYFHEVVLQTSKPVESILSELSLRGIQVGYPLAGHYPELKNSLLFCATETKSTEDIQYLAQQLNDAMQGRKLACTA